MDAIELFKIGKKFGKVWTVKDLSLKVKKGEFLGILGPSGCGKTTLLRLIAGLEEPDKGKVFLNTQLVNNPKILVPPQKREIGMVFQDLALWPHMNVYAHLEFVLKEHAQKLKIKNEKLKIREEIERLLELMRLPKRYLNYFPHQLSGGERQRLAIARALAQNPKILLFDEPLANLDEILKNELGLEIARLQKKLAITTIYVTHNFREIIDLANCIAIMREGRLIQLGTPSEILKNPKQPFVAKILGKGH